jgi:hypothetical protein
MPLSSQNDSNVIEELFLDEIGGGRPVRARPDVKIDAAILQAGFERRVDSV